MLIGLTLSIVSAAGGAGGPPVPAIQLDGVLFEYRIPELHFDPPLKRSLDTLTFQSVFADIKRTPIVSLDGINFDMSLSELTTTRVKTLDGMSYNLGIADLHFDPPLMRSLDTLTLHQSFGDLEYLQNMQAEASSAELYFVMGAPNFVTTPLDGFQMHLAVGALIPITSDYQTGEVSSVNLYFVMGETL